jgi:hypothetical protein
MNNPYFQVARTYLPVKLSHRISGILVLVALFFFVSFVSGKHKFLPFQLFLFTAWFSNWAIHVREQFADSRASLTPGFRKVHGVVATIVAFVFVILLPGAIALLIGWQPLGLVSITTFLFGIILWGILRLGHTFILLILVGWIFTFFEPTQNGIEKIVSGNEAFTFLSVGVVLSITGIIRLFLLNEEKPEYHLGFNKTIDGRSKLSVRQWQKLEKSCFREWRRWFANRTVVGMIYHARHATDWYWSRMLRWNYSNRTVWFGLFYATLFNLICTFIHFPNYMSTHLAIRIYLATVAPVSFVNNNEFKVKSHFMAQQLMMPVSRDAYLKQVGMCFATRQLAQWGVIMDVTVLWMLASVAKPTPEFLIISISYSAIMQIWLFGLSFWISSFNSTIMNFVVFNLGIVLLMAIPVSSAQITFPWSHILAALLACLGLLLTWWGYRRWLVADLE